MRVCLSFLLPVCLCLGARAQAQPPGAPGLPHRWGAAFKQAIGTAYEKTGAASPVWFTIADGILTEVFYPSVDLPQTGELQFLVTDGRSFFSEQKRDTDSKVTYFDEGMAVQIVSTERQGRYILTQEIVTDSAAPVVRLRVRFQPFLSDLRLFVFLKPAINNVGAGNIGYAAREGLFASRQGIVRRGDSIPSRSHDLKPVHLALLSSAPFAAVSTGYTGFSDAIQDLSRNFRISHSFNEAGPGAIGLVGELRTPHEGESTFDLALGFGASRSEAQTYARTSLFIPFSTVRTTYEKGWTDYLAGLEGASARSGSRFIAESTAARRSAQLLKMHEDKRQRGALVAALSKPAPLDDGQARDGSGGYHAVWTRDLYASAVALLAAGDYKTARDSLDYCRKTQRADGSWPQNFWVNGTSAWLGLQLDEVAFPILLAGQLKKRAGHVLTPGEVEMIRRAAGFIISHGPATEQDRWEELSGFSPATLAVEIAALRAATTLTKDPIAAEVATRWQSLLETWTLAQDGSLGENYYLRISPTGKPGSDETLLLAGAPEPVFADEVVDGGFLNLVRMGVRQAEDPRILSTLRLYESTDLALSARSKRDANGMKYRRYPGDTYGENRVGGFWPLLAAERGQYAVAAGDLDRARAQLLVVERAMSPSGLLPEQSGGRGIAAPLAWAHAEYLLLHRSIETRAVFDTPPGGPDVP